MNDNCDWMQAFGELIVLTGADDFYTGLCRVLSRIPEGDCKTALYFPNNAAPELIYIGEEIKDNPCCNIQNYIKGLYILDPFYRATLQGIDAGAYQLSEFAPDDFKKTEYFRHHYKATGFNDELTFIQPLPNNGYIHLSLGNRNKKGKFSKENVRLLKTLSPIVNGLMLKHWQLISTIKTDDASLHSHQALQQALQSFGSSLLTDRELELLQLILHGHSNKSAADKMGITLSTVKLHRKHIYQKMDISSQAELFYLFIDSFSSTKHLANCDPLYAYMGLPI